MYFLVNTINPLSPLLIYISNNFYQGALHTMAVESRGPSLRGQGRSQLKYTNYKLCRSLERKFCLLEEDWVSIYIVDKFSSIGQMLGTKTPKKCNRRFGGVVHWLLASTMKVERTNFCSSLIKLLEPFVRSTNSRSMKCP
jgi:hypothetical protein